MYASITKALIRPISQLDLIIYAVGILWGLVLIDNALKLISSSIYTLVRDYDNACGII